MREKILVADDEESIRFTFSSFLSDAGYRVETTDSVSGCIRIMGQEPIDLLFLDIGFGRESGLDGLRQIKEQFPGCPIVMITGNPQTTTITRARQCGATDYLVKPIRQASLLYIARKVLAH